MNPQKKPTTWRHSRRSCLFNSSEHEWVNYCLMYWSVLRYYNDVKHYDIVWECMYVIMWMDLVCMLYRNVDI